MRLPKRRVEAWLEALDKAALTAERLEAALGRVTVILHGSYARGDFNLWSDIDLIVVSERFMGVRFLDRYRLIQDHVEAGVEVVPLTPGEFKALIAKPAWRQALARGLAVVLDGYKLAPLIEEATGSQPASLGNLRDRVRRLMGEAVDV